LIGKLEPKTAKKANNDAPAPTAVVTAVGHRLKLLEAIAALRNDTSGKMRQLTQRPRPAPNLFSRRPRRTAPSLRTLGVLLIVTYRPEFEPLWIGRPYVDGGTKISVHALTARNVWPALAKPTVEVT
jgi:hypothetical protein